MKTILIVILIMFFAQVEAQINTVRIHCNDSLGFISNQGITRECQFYFENESPTIFYVENFRHIDFYKLIYKNDTKLISRAKLVTANYEAKIHDFIFTSNKNNALLFYYILKDHQEEKLLQP